MRFTYSLISILLLAFAFEASSQVIHPFRGVVADSLRTPLAGATIRVFLQGGDSLAVISGKNGGFQIREVGGGAVKLQVSLVGYRSVERCIRRGVLSGARLSQGEEGSFIPDTIFLARDFTSLDTIIVTSLAPVVLKGDTIEYRAGAYAMQPGDLVEDLVRRFPGVSVDMKGQITAQGKQISRITVNGKDFFGDDILIATQNLPADIVKNIQVIQDYGEESRLTGIKMGQPVTILNINTRDDKKRGEFGQVTAGYGTGGAYMGNVFANKFNTDQRIAVTGNASNVDAGGAGGINNHQTVGLNYGDRWSDKLAGNGSYLSGHNSGSVSGESVQQSIFPNANTINNSRNTSDSRASSQNMNYALEFTPDKSNTVSIHIHGAYSSSEASANNNFSITQSDSLQQKLSTGYSRTTGTGQTTNIGTDLLFVHHFRKAGQLITISTSLNDNRTGQDNENLNNSSVSEDGGPVVLTPLHQHLANDNSTGNADIKLTFMQPIAKRTSLLLTYGYINNRNISNRSTFNIDSVSGAYSLVDSLSDKYSYSQTTHSGGVGLNNNGSRFDYNLLLSVQPVILNGNSVSNHFATNYRTIVFIPSMNLNYKLKKVVNLALNYSAASGMPDFRQLRPTTDLSNPQYPVTGNPNLKPSYSHNLILGMNMARPDGEIFSVNMGITETQNSIVANITNNPLNTAGGAGSVIQETSYLNVNGLYSLNSFYNYSHPFMGSKLVLGLAGGAGYNNNISFVNSIRTVNATWLWNQGMRFAVNLPNLMDLGMNTNYSISGTASHSDSSINTTIHSLAVALNGRNYFLHRFVFVYDIGHTFNKGYSGAVANNPTNINAYLEYWIWKDKKASVKLQCYNLLDQQNVIGRTISGNTITDSQVNRVGRYFMCTVNIRLNKFAGGK